MINQISCVDLFCGAGGLTHGLQLEGLSVVAGYDLDSACKYPYEANNDAKFIETDICELADEELMQMYPPGSIRVLAGCAPCQPFSKYRQGTDNQSDHKWGLLYEFIRLVKKVKPEIVTMENVSTIQRHRVYADFIESLKQLGYEVDSNVVDCSKYGVPQTRNRVVLLASKLGPIKLVAPTHTKPRTVKQAIGQLRPINAGASDSKDKLHTAASLSNLNMKRIKKSRPGGSWRDWPDLLVADCHKAHTGRTYPSVYGRMEWDKPAPTMTTQCFGFGNGRFGHPEQNRAISLREASILQSFPRSYKFVPRDGQVEFKKIGRLIGNAVPVKLGRVIARSILKHVEENAPSRQLAPSSQIDSHSKQAGAGDGPRKLDDAS